MADSHQEEVFAATGGASVTPSDTARLEPMARSLWVGGAGNVAVVTSDGSALTFTGVPGGTILPVQCKQVKSTSTTATSILALY